MSDSVDKNSKEWKDQVQLVQKNADKYLKLSTDIETTKVNISRLSQELTDSKTKFEQLGNKTETLDEKLENISREAELTQSEFNKLGTQLNQNGTYFQKLGNEINKLSSEIKSGIACGISLYIFSLKPAKVLKSFLVLTSFIVTIIYPMFFHLYHSTNQ